MIASNNDEQLLEIATKLKEAYQPAEIAQLVRMLSPTPNTGEMTVEGFERVMMAITQSKGRTYSDKSITAVRLVLVMGASISEAAEEVGLTRQVVSRLILRIRARMESLPQDWVKTCEWFPVEVAKQLVGLSESLKELQTSGSPADTLSFTIRWDKPTG